jgi:hypothetical protein
MFFMCNGLKEVGELKLRAFARPHDPQLCLAACGTFRMATATRASGIANHLAGIDSSG